MKELETIGDFIRSRNLFTNKTVGDIILPFCNWKIPARSEILLLIRDEIFQQLVYKQIIIIKRYIHLFHRRESTGREKLSANEIDEAFDIMPVSSSLIPYLYQFIMSTVFLASIFTII